MRRLPFSEAKSRYTNRYTGEHRPLWALSPAPNGKFYAPQFRNDAEWYANTTFPGDHNHQAAYVGDTACHTSGETWPLGKWLEAPFNAVAGGL